MASSFKVLEVPGTIRDLRGRWLEPLSDAPPALVLRKV